MKPVKHNRKISVVVIVFGICAGLWSSSAGSARTSEINSTNEPVLGPPDGTKYQIAAGQSNFAVHASVGGLFSAFGHDHNIAIRGISGEVGLNSNDLGQSWLHMKVRADSLAVIDKISDSDRKTIEQTMRDETLETGKFPEITFYSMKVEGNKVGEDEYQARITGDLALHGVTHSKVITARVSVKG
jgi:polyisoprenoid-binding protein YceI